MIPFDFFGLVEGDKIVSMKFVIMKKVYLTSKDRVDEDLIIDVCSD
jgi:hypothetical protein